MTDKIFPEDNEKTQMMAAPPPLVKPSPLDQTQLMSAPPPLVNSETPVQVQTTIPVEPENNPPNFAYPPGGGNSGTPTSNPGGGASGRAIASLVLAIASFICCGIFTAIPAIILGRMEEGAINRGEAPEAGRSLAKIGWILGLISTILNCLFMLGFGLYMLLVGGTVGSGILDIMHQAQQPNSHFTP